MKLFARIFRVTIFVLPVMSMISILLSDTELQDMIYLLTLGLYIVVAFISFFGIYYLTTSQIDGTFGNRLGPVLIGFPFGLLFLGFVLSMFLMGSIAMSFSAMLLGIVALFGIILLTETHSIRQQQIRRWLLVHTMLLPFAGILSVIFPITRVKFLAVNLFSFGKILITQVPLPYVTAKLLHTLATDAKMVSEDTDLLYMTPGQK